MATATQPISFDSWPEGSTGDLPQTIQKAIDKAQSPTPAWLYALGILALYVALD